MPALIRIPFLAVHLIFVPRPSIAASSAQPGERRSAGDPEGGAPFVEADPAHPDKLVGFDVEIAELIARGCLWRQSPWRMTLHHDESHPSHVLLPVTQGNLVGTFLFGGELPDLEPGEKPYAKFHMPKE